MNDTKIKNLCKTAVMAALVFLGTYFFKLPSPNGYIHLGDCMIFMAVILLGGKRGALAGGIGGALSDLLGGYMLWIIPTFIIKTIMALIMASICKTALGEKKFGWVIGATLGGAFQVTAYAIAGSLLYNLAYGISEIPGNIFQTASGIIIATVVIGILTETGIIRVIKNA